MERKLITTLAVVDGQGNLAGIIHLHDLLGRGEIRFFALRGGIRDGLHAGCHGIWVRGIRCDE